MFRYLLSRLHCQSFQLLMLTVVVVAMVPNLDQDLILWIHLVVIAIEMVLNVMLSTDQPVDSILY